MKRGYTASIAIVSFFCVLFYSCESVYVNVTPEDNRSLQQHCFQGKKVFDEEILDYGRAFLDSLCGYSFQGRKAGTEGWEKSYSFLSSEIKEMGYEFKSQPFQTEQGTRIKNIIVNIPGDIDSLLIIGAHLDGAEQSSGKYHFPAANDNGSGTTTLMLLLKSISQKTLNTSKTVILIFGGCEEVLEISLPRILLFHSRFI